ncbi:MAG: FAD-binding protein [Christensenellales bacterium]
MVSKEPLGLSNSYLAQGGIAGELNTSEEILAKHIEDTLIAGSGLFDKEAIKELVYDASENLQMLIDLGVPFDVDESGKSFLLKKEDTRLEEFYMQGGCNG